MSDAPPTVVESLAEPAAAEPHRPTLRQAVEWVTTAIGILTGGTAIWSAFTVLGATAENARSRIFERQLDACLSVSETGSAFVDSLADARAALDVRASLKGMDADTLEKVLGPEQKRTAEATKTAEAAFDRNVREVRILFPKSVSDVAVKLSAHGTAASATMMVAWATNAPDSLAAVPVRLQTVRDEVGQLSEACAASLASTAQLSRE